MLIRFVAIANRLFRCKLFLGLWKKFSGYIVYTCVWYVGKLEGSIPPPQTEDWLELCQYTGLYVYIYIYVSLIAKYIFTQNSNIYIYFSNKTFLIVIFTIKKYI